MFFSRSPESGHKLVAAFLECNEIAVGLDLPSKKGRNVGSEQLTHRRIQCTIGGNKGGIIDDEMG